MALVNHSKKWIFFHLYKCGGNSLRDTLNNAFKGQTIEMQGVHNLPKDLKLDFDNNLGKGVFESYYKFTIIRNPFDFYLSTYLYCKRFANHFLYNEIHEKNLTLFDFIATYDRVRNEQRNAQEGTNKVCTLSEYVDDDNGKCLVDYIGRLETINESYSDICKSLGIEKDLVPFKNVNADRSKDYKQYYNEETINRVTQLFHKDLERFNYKF
tara:strand:- start:263 stop:895 length:633 start_codon:yes stop_codon:yes gene_type:complete